MTLEQVAGTLVARGMSESEAAKKQDLFAVAERALRTEPSARWFVPGRIEVLGKHTDYAGGRSLLCAVERGFCVAATALDQPRVEVLDALSGANVHYELGKAWNPKAGWTVYPLAVLQRLVQNFGELRGARIAFANDLPRSAGMSSSSALVIAIFTALAHVNELEQRPEYAAVIRTIEDRAAYAACMENGQSFCSLEGSGGVGTFGGSEDHTAILCCHAGEMSQYRFCPAKSEVQVAMPRGCVFVIGTSGVHANKTGAAKEQYNRASLLARSALQTWNQSSGRSDATLFEAASENRAEEVRRALRDSRPREFSAKELAERFEQFYRETMEIVPAAADALREGNLARFGELVDESQRCAEEMLHNQVPQTIELARSARKLGVVAASAFGAGFGGAVWAMVQKEAAQDFARRWREAYSRAFPDVAARAEFFETTAGPPVNEV